MEIFSFKYKKSSNTSLAEIQSVMDEYGLVVIEDYLPKNKLNDLNAEFDKFLSIEDTAYKKSIAYSLGSSAYINREKLDTQKFPTTAEVFKSGFMADFTKLYLGNTAVLNHEIVVVNDVIGSKHIANDLHFDVVPTLKFFIYLTDTTEENGAFKCVPGSHKHTENIRKETKNISYKNREVTRDLPFTDKDAVSIEGMAGTLIIFSTEVFHKAGIVSKGERRVMRGHSRKVKYLKKGVLAKIKTAIGL